MEGAVQLRVQQLQDWCGACFWLSSDLLEVPKNTGASEHNMPQFMVSVHFLCNIIETKGVPVIKPLPLSQELEQLLAPAGAMSQIMTGNQTSGTACSRYSGEPPPPQPLFFFPNPGLRVMNFSTLNSRN